MNRALASLSRRCTTLRLIHWTPGPACEPRLRTSGRYYRHLPLRYRNLTALVSNLFLGQNKTISVKRCLCSPPRPPSSPHNHLLSENLCLSQSACHGNGNPAQIRHPAASMCAMAALLWLNLESCYQTCWRGGGGGGGIAQPLAVIALMDLLCRWERVYYLLRVFKKNEEENFIWLSGITIRRYCFFPFVIWSPCCAKKLRVLCGNGLEAV